MRCGIWEARREWVDAKYRITKGQTIVACKSGERNCFQSLWFFWSNRAVTHSVQCPLLLNFCRTPAISKYQLKCSSVVDTTVFPNCCSWSQRVRKAWTTLWERYFFSWKLSHVLTYYISRSWAINECMQARCGSSQYKLIVSRLNNNKCTRGGWAEACITIKIDSHGMLK